MDALRREPGATFDIEAEFGNGQKLHGTVGPMVNGAVVAQIRFDREPTREETDAAVRIMNLVMGTEFDEVAVVRGVNAANAVRRRFMGGGQG